MSDTKRIAEIARKLHEVYENQARLFGWVTQEVCRVDFDDLPEANIKTMLGVATHLHQEVVRGKIEEFRHARKIILMFPERVAEYCEDRETDLKAELKKMGGVE